MNIAIFTREYILANWEEFFRKHRYEPELMQKMVDRMMEVMKLEDERIIMEEMIPEMMEARRKVIQMAESECPIGFFKPSWEQAQFLNAWHPDFEPSVAPEGYRTFANFSTNRGGKTTGVVVDTSTWLIPNNKDWVMFETHEDLEGKKHGKDRGCYTVFPRPDYDAWQRTGRMIYPWDSAAPKEGAEIWHGVENDNHWHDKVGKEYLKWLPRTAISRRADGGTAIFKQERRIDLRSANSITGKTYNSDPQDWAGKAVWRINMDEGFGKRVFDEAVMRVQSGGHFTWAYTVAEARNIGERAKLAHDCYKGKHKLVGKAKFFTGFRMDMIPDWIMPADKKADDLARLRMEGEMGRVRMGEIPFFESSPTVFSNFERERNVLPIEGSEVVLAIRGETPERWRKEFGEVRAQRLSHALFQANIIRGMDEGLANPTACVWQAILRTGEGVFFREWEESGLSVTERCEKIIDLSGNIRELQNPGVIQERQRWREVQPRTGGMTVKRTFADSKMFKRNPESPQDDWTSVYVKAGLKIERATNIGPAARCDYLNDGLRADPTRKHLLNASENGPRVYMTRDCMKLIERMENYLWQQIAQGARAGAFTDKPSNDDDHVIDGATYCSGAKLRWMDQQVSQSNVRIDSLTGAVVR